MDDSNKVAERKFLQYVDEIIANPQKASLDMDALAPEHQPMALALQKLAAHVADQERRLESDATVDRLTGIGNRLAFDAQVQQLWDKKIPCTVAFVDLDELKNCNDHAGHREGDHYIQRVSAVLDRLCRDGESVYRIGGDEFVILSPWASEEELSARLSIALNDFVTRMEKLVDYHCGFSYGCKRMEECTQEAYNNLLATADQRMYEFKLHQRQLRQEQDDDMPREEVFSADYGLETRLFDALSMTMRHRYIYACNVRNNMSRWSQNAVKDFALPGEYMYDAANIWLQHIHPDDRAAYIQNIEEVFSGKRLFHDMEYRALDANGYYVMCSCKGYLLKAKGEESDLFVGTIENHGVIDNVDPVTNLYNVYAFLNELKRIQHEHTPVDLLVLGISGFNMINDGYGYERGNEVLRDIAQRLNERKRGDGELFRLNGMKFVYMMPCCPRSEIHQLYEEALDIVNNQTFVGGDPVKLYMPAAAVHYEGTTEEGSVLLSELDYLIDVSKREKSGEMIYVDGQADDTTKKRIRILSTIKRCILNNCQGFFLMYQPQIDAKCHIVGAEALLRWRNLTYGTVPPNEFIPWLENDISFYDLGLWILRKALFDGLTLIKDNPDFTMSVNISYKQLERERFLEDVLEIIEQTGFPAQNVILEFTEHCRTLENSRLQYIVEFFAKHGIRVAADDFGTGYSALMLLRSIRFDTVKIDQNFIGGMLESTADRILVNTIIECAHKLDTKVCVEGVETQELLNITRSYKAEYYQGYLIAKPLELGNLKIFMEGNRLGRG